MSRQRPSWDEYFMSIAFQVATRSTCDRAHVGAIIVKDRRILTTGYNGAPMGLPHCDEVGHLMVDGHCVRTLHAEQNAIIQAALHGVSVRGGTIYVTHQPCHTCAKMIINAGLVRVVYAGEYPDPLAVEFLQEANVKLEHMAWSPEKQAAVSGLADYFLDQGRISAWRAGIVRVLRQRFGEEAPVEDIAWQLEQVDDEDRLKALFDQALAVATVADFHL